MDWRDKSEIPLVALESRSYPLDRRLQPKCRAIVVLSEYRQKRRHKFVADENGRPFSLPQIIENNGEPWRARTSDPLIKSQLLYQLS